MLYPTIINIAAKQLIGIYDAYGIKNNSISNRVNACTIPATGVLPPFFTLAAVLAIAPVAGIPPKSADIKFPTPWATNSAFDLCLLPVIPSDTTADNSDSIAANIAIVNAGKIISLISENEIVGIVKLGSPALIVYRSPIVLTGNLKIATKNVVTSIAIKEPGIFLDTFGQNIWISIASNPIAKVTKLILFILCP